MTVLAWLCFLALWCGLWAPFWWCCCNVVCARIVFVDPCNRDITVTKGDDTYPLTSSGGNRQTDLLSSGTYTWVAAGSDCIEEETGTVTITCPQSNVTVNVPRTPAEGYVLAFGTSCCCGVGPECIEMDVTNDHLNNQIFNSCTITWQALPSWTTPLGLGTHGYLSTTTFPDGSTGDPFYYYLSCSSGQIVLTRIYETSLFGSPYRDAVRYRWVPGDSCGDGDNECCPFDLPCGTIFTGGDANTKVRLTEIACP